MKQKNETSAGQVKPSRRYLTIVLLVLAGAVASGAIYMGVTNFGRPATKVQPPQANPLMAQQVIARAGRLIQAGHLTDARDLLVSHLNSYPSDNEVRSALAKTYMALGRNDLARVEVDVVLKNAPQQSDALWLKGDLIRAAGAAGGENFVQYYKRAAESPDAGPGIWALYGGEMLKAGLKDDAAKYLQKALDKGLRDSRTLLPLGEIAFEENRFADAKKLLTEAIKDPSCPLRAWLVLASAQKNESELKAAEETLLDAIDSAGDDADQAVARMELAEVLLLQDRTQEAVEEFVHAAELHAPLRFDGYLRAARCYFVLNKISMAKLYVDGAVKLQPQDPEAIEWKKKIDSAATRLAATAPASAPAGKTAKPAPAKIPNKPKQK